MKYEEFKRQLGKAGLTNKQFADLVGMNEKSVSNIAQREDVPNQIAVSIVLMGMLADNHIPFREAIEKLELKKAEPRGKGFEKTKS